MGSNCSCAAVHSSASLERYPKCSCNACKIIKDALRFCGYREISSVISAASLGGTLQLIVGPLAVALSHHEIERAEDRYRVAHHVARQQVGENAQVHERRRADLEPMRRPSPFAIDVKAEFAFGVLSGKVNLTRRRGHPLRDKNELMNQFFHLG